MLSAQLDGQASAVVNANAYYQFDDGMPHPTLLWQATGGGVVSHSVIDGTTYLATISFTTPGTQTVSVKVGRTVLGSMPVTVTCNTPVPNAAFTVTNNCGSTVIRYTNSPPPYVFWYWQTSSSGFTQNLGNSTSLTVTSPGTYYLAALAGTCWSSGAQNTGAVSINAVPNITVSPSAQTICGGGTGSGTIGSNVSGTSFSWTASPTGNVSASILSGSTSTFGSYIGNSSGTQGSVTYNVQGTTPAGCQNTASATITVNSLPSTTVTNSSPYICSGSQTNISMSSPVSGTTFSWTPSPSGVNGASSSSGSAINQTLSVSGGSNGSVQYAIRATTPAGCQDNTYPSVVVNAPSAGGNLSVSQSQVCNSATVNLSLAGNVGGITRYASRYQDNGGGWTGWASTSSAPSLTSPASGNRVYQFQGFAQNSNCAEAGSNIVSTTVYAAATTGTVSASPNSICASGTVTVSAPSLNSTSTQWQYRYSDNAGASFSSWSTFSSANTSPQSFAVTSSTTDRQYQVQVIVQNGSCAYTSNSFNVSVNAPSAGGNLSVSQSQVCNSATVNLSLAGNVGGITRYASRYQDNGGGWTGWASTSSAPSLTSPASGNRVYQFQGFAQNSNCAEAGSNIVSTTVYAAATTGTVSASPNSICASGTVTVSAPSLNSTSTQWQYRYSDNAGASYSSWSTFSSANTSPQSFAVTSSTTDRQYQVQVIVQNGSCAYTSNSFNVSVSSSNGGQVSPPLIEGYFSPLGLPASISASGYIGTFQKWQQSTNGGASWSDTGLPNTDPTYSFLASVSAQYRALLSNGACSSFTSPVANVVIYTIPTIQLTDPSQPPALSLGGQPVSIQVPNTYRTYQWQKAGTDIPGATSNIYQATEPASYNVRVTSSATSPSATTAAFKVYGVGLQPDNTVNAVVTTTIRKSGVTPSTNIYTSLQATDYAQTVQYLDALSRPLQTIAIGQSPLQHDVVQPFSYDTLQPISYLPYVATTKDGTRRTTAISNGGYANSDQYLFYQQSGVALANSTAPYAKTIYENSPLSRVLEQGAPGTDWQPGAHTVKPIFHTNNTAFGVRRWSAAGPTGYYAANTLAAAHSTDENGNPVIIYADKLGRTILKRVKAGSNPQDTTTWLETYYVYDLRGNVAMQVSPKASALLNSGIAWSTSTLRDPWCYVYTYDGRNRLVQKQVPGAPAPVYYVYDPLGRLVLTQDGRLRTTNQWAFVKYDAKGRPVMGGIYTNATQTTLSAVQNLVSGLYTNPASPYFEDRATTLHGYTNQSFPTQNADASALQILSVNYYDNYDFDYNGSPDYGYTTQGIVGEQLQGNSFGLATGSKRLVLGTSTWLYTYIFYDRFGRTIQSRSNNHLSSAIDNLATIGYDFEGKVLQTKTYHNAGGANQVTTLQTPAYDNQGRLLWVSHSINGAPPVVVAQYNYNELGQMVKKNLHCTNCQDPANNTAPPSGGTFLQGVDYRYNIRGWLSSINNAQLADDGGATNSDANDYFGMELFYNNTETSALGNTPTYNGNISSVKWKNGGAASGATDQRSYKYSYDKSDRLLSSTFQANNGSAWTKEAGTLNEAMTYDANGNILSLARNQNLRGLSGTVETSMPQAIDNLMYTYGSGNRLTKVADASGNSAGFKDGAAQNTEYKYDTLGSLTVDRNKGISAVAYNVLGKPAQVTFSDGRVITYTYDAAGTKLTVVTTAGSTTTTNDYVGSFVYTNSNLSFFSSPEGRVVKNGSLPAGQAGDYEYQYAIADHQGNTRVLFTSAAQPAQSVTATFETADQTTEATQFSNYGHISGTANHTAGGTNSQYLNGGYAGMVGVAKSYKVFPGDQLKIEAYGSYNEPGGNSSSLISIGSALLSAFNLAPPVAGEAGTASVGINTWGGMVAAGYGDGSPNNADPKAFVNIVLFDKNYNFLDVAYAQLKGTSLYYMSANYTVKEAGYAYLYVSNEQANMTDVYFDDVKMSYTPGNILQSNEYYPFGLQTANSWTRDNTTNNFLANGGTELNTTSALYDLEFRNYDPILGRMNQVDPLADKYSSHTPYNFSFNRPVSINDPNGADPFRGITTVMQDGTPGHGGGNGHGPDPDHPFAGWMGGMSNGNGYSEYGMFGDIGDTPFGGGFFGLNRLSVMEMAAQAVKDGYMSVSTYAEMYGTPWNGEITVGEYTSTFSSSTTAVISNGQVVWVNSSFKLRQQDRSVTLAYNGNNFIDLAQSDPGFIMKWSYNVINTNSNPDYKGVGIHLRYVPSETDKFSEYNWIVLTTTNHNSSIITDPNDFINHGPFYYGEGGNRDIEKSFIYDAAEFSSVNFAGEMTLYGKLGNDWTEIGTATFEFNYSNGTLTATQPTITYKGR